MSKRSLQINPALKEATWEDIKAKRDALIASPITTEHGVFDAGQVSISRMDGALLDPLVTELGWKLHDNTFVRLTPAQLNDVRIDISRRTGRLFVVAEMLKTSGPYRVRDLDNPNMWGLPD